MKARFLLLSGCLLGAEAVHAQTSYNPDPATTSAQQLAQDLGVERIRYALSPNVADFRNTASLEQVGTGNTAIINQASQAILANQATIQQNGTGNLLNLNQTGSNNQTGFSQNGSYNQATLRQQGNGNTIYGQVAGDNNTIDATQQGTGNQYLTELTGSRGRYTVEQIGANNSLKLRETSTTTALPGYSIRMESSNMHITVEQGKIFP